MQIIYFDFDKSKLTNVNIKEIKSFLDENKKNINKYLIVGHTDTKGKIDYNINLSLDRAKAVKNKPYCAEHCSIAYIDEKELRKAKEIKQNKIAA